MKYYTIYAVLTALAVLQLLIKIWQRDWDTAIPWASGALAWYCAYSAARTGETYKTAWHNSCSELRQMANECKCGS